MYVDDVCTVLNADEILASRTSKPSDELNSTTKIEAHPEEETRYKHHRPIRQEF